MYNQYEWYRQTNKLLNDIEKAINGQYSAIQCYAKLAQMAPNEKERNQILEIRKDEKRHLRQFKLIYQSLTGKQAEPKLLEGCPNNYLDGLEFALLDEQETVDFYHGIASETSNSYIKDAFTRAASDEQNHAVWFLYFLTKHWKKKR
ncbi:MULTISPECIES: ferritin-like domain-containing protein [unclassified Bacillus (in: firmicutes)]|uniref:ferritin-like domain-containing protein n=1 Tax=unclassified Bacillus (in: firmicutes) TaxID=185979 RepID=UPI0008E3CA51|nr:MULTISPECIES: ferritin-like domain-containing protein [unclassified Bacillus (in: firmicutes)]SFA71313.1 Rubrerythrin [Bacillus sp. UNCCL13]SFQ61486.1 Rubrerythrin [Bacillus sp. cl95]